MGIIKAYILLFIVFTSGISHAATVQGTITVQITIVSSCTISVNSLLFGQYIPPNTLDGNTSLSVICTNHAPYQIGLDAGAGINRGATVETRKMISANGNTLNYSLYKDAARTIVWGNTTTGPNVNTASGSGNGLVQNFTIFGKVFSNPLSPAGSYSDTIIATVYF